MTAICPEHTFSLSAAAGANNRLDVKDIVSFDRGSQTAMPLSLGKPLPEIRCSVGERSC